MWARMPERIRLAALITKHAYLCGRNYRVCPGLNWPNKPEIGKKNCFSKHVDDAQKCCALNTSLTLSQNTIETPNLTLNLFPDHNN